MKSQAGIRSLLIFLLAVVAQPAYARITHIVVDPPAEKPWTYENKIFGKIGTYERIRGLAYGEIAPDERHNRIIQDVLLAPRNGRGKVEYAATFTLYLPTDRDKWSGILIEEIVNRGAALLPNRFESGDAFLVSGWQGDLPFRGKSIYGLPGETIRVPVAQSSDGTSVTGQVVARFADIPAGQVTIQMKTAAGYLLSGPAPIPLDLDTTHAKLTARTFEAVTGFGSTPLRIDSSDWSWGDCASTPFPGKPDPARICLKEGFNSSLLYELSYTGKDPLVLGVGLAATRDLVSFFRRSAADETGWKNPFPKRRMSTIVRGESQAGNLIRTFLNLGFNEDESGQIVFDGAMPVIAPRQVPVNVRFGIPGGIGGLQELGSDGTDWWEHWPDAVRGHPASGLLDRCRRSRTCPKIIELMGSTEFWSLRASPNFVGTSNDRDIPLPPEVRRYYVASTQHGGGGGGFRVDTPSPTAAAPCALPSNPNPMKEIRSALLEDLEAWITRGVEPPNSIYPTLAKGTLVPEREDEMHFPGAPQLPLPGGMANPLLVYDLGDSFQYNDLSGVATPRPSVIMKVVFPLVPKTNDDGNEIGGIHTVLQVGSLGTYLGWNVSQNGFYKGQYCSLLGSYIPFAHTRVERLKQFDPRLSLEERYGTQRGYSCVTKQAANHLLDQRLLLPEDAAALIGQAARSAVLPSDEDSSEAARKRADLVCMSPPG